MNKGLIKNVVLKIGFGLMKIPAACICGVWKCLIKVLVVIVGEILSTLGVINEALKSMVE